MDDYHDDDVVVNMHAERVSGMRMWEVCVKKTISTANPEWNSVNRNIFWGAAGEMERKEGGRVRNVMGWPNDSLMVYFVALL